MTDDSKFILIVDDEPELLEFLNIHLAIEGYETVKANNGKEALDILEQYPDRIQAVISDVEMPVMDGYTLTKSIRSDERLRSLPVMLHTSLSGSFNDSMVKNVGADRFVPKFRAEEFADEVTALAKDKGLI